MSMKNKMERNIGGVLANRNIEIAEIIIKLFSLRLLVILTFPYFGEYLSNSRQGEGRPWVLMVVVVISLLTWMYGFFYDKLKWRKIGIGLSIFMHTFLLLVLLMTSPHQGMWMIYLITSTSSMLLYSRLNTRDGRV